VFHVKQRQDNESHAAPLEASVIIPLPRGADSKSPAGWTPPGTGSPRRCLHCWSRTHSLVSRETGSLIKFGWRVWTESMRYVRRRGRTCFRLHPRQRTNEGPHNPPTESSRRAWTPPRGDETSSRAINGRGMVAKKQITPPRS